jgi:hypothetical protein
MASVQAYNNLKNHLITVHAPLQVIDFDSIETVLEQSNDSFLCLEELSSLEDMIGFGDPTNLCIREVSAIAIHALVPAPESTGLARQLAENVQNDLRFRILNGVDIMDIEPPVPDFMNAGLWTSYSVTVLIKVDRHVAKP